MSDFLLHILAWGLLLPFAVVLRAYHRESAKLSRELSETLRREHELTLELERILAKPPELLPPHHPYRAPPPELPPAFQPTSDGREVIRIAIALAVKAADTFADLQEAKDAHDQLRELARAPVRPVEPEAAFSALPEPLKLYVASMVPQNGKRLRERRPDLFEPDKPRQPTAFELRCRGCPDAFLEGCTCAVCSSLRRSGRDPDEHLHRA